MYTSGTTAKPKGIVHTTAGYLVGVSTTHHYIFDLKPEDDVYWCAADIGWITGHSYIVYGPLCNAATSVLYEGTPDFPDKDRWWDIVYRYGVTILYTAPTAIRAHMKWGPQYAAQHDLSSLRLLGSVGEPINPEAWIWYHEHVGGDRCPIVDTWWQTETGMILITPLPGVTTTKPGSATKPFPGVQAAVLDDQGERVEQGGGYLVLERPWPAMTRGIYGDDARYRTTYWERFPGLYFAGDGARIDEDGDFWLLGRVDDVMNVVRAPDLDDRGRVRARRPPQRRRGCSLRPLGRDDRPGDRRLRDAQERRRAVRGDARGAAEPRRPQDRRRSRSRRTSSSRPSCPRLARARSCVASCATWRRTGRSATRRRSPTRLSCPRSRSARRRRRPRTSPGPRHVRRRRPCARRRRRSCASPRPRP